MATFVKQWDGKDNIFVDVSNLRITYIESGNRNPDKDWSGMDVLRIQAYRGAGNELHMGSEMPMPTKAEIKELISALVDLYDHIETKSSD